MPNEQHRSIVQARGDLLPIRCCHSARYISPLYKGVLIRDALYARMLRVTQPGGDGSVTQLYATVTRW